MTGRKSQTFFSRRAWCVSCAIWTLSALLVAAPLLAAPINYGNFSGVTVDYLQVTEDANSAGDSPPLFGPPSVSGDSIDFDPVGFNANSAGGGADITDGQLLFTVMAKPNRAINSITFAEAGDVTLLGLGNDGTFAGVTTSMFIDIVEVDGAPINVVSANNLSIPFSPSGGTFGLGTDGGGGPIFSSGWSGSLTVNTNALLTAAGVPFRTGATKINVNMDNILSALSQTATSALIAKKNANGIVITVNVPEPGTFALAVLGVAGVWMRRRMGS
jgi:hypothetical protein